MIQIYRFIVKIVNIWAIFMCCQELFPDNHYSLKPRLPFLTNDIVFNTYELGELGYLQLTPKVEGLLNVWVNDMLVNRYSIEQ